MILDLKGKLTAGLGDQILRESVDELLAEGWKRILLNLSEVSFLDSAGPRRARGRAQDREAVRGRAEAPERGRRVQSTLYMSRLLPVFEIYASEAEALAHFGKA